jgi:hypothetical protein
MRDTVDLCAGIEGPYGEIRAFSNADVPGLIVIGIRNPPVLLAEQTIHESTHVRLALRIDADQTLSRILEEMPACASPFTGSIRPAERVLHGVVSYGRVLRMWEAIQRHSLVDPTWFADTGDHGTIIRRRVTELNERVVRGWSSLVAAATASEHHLLAQVCAEFVGSKPQSKVFEDRARQELLAQLKPVPRAEVILAAAGCKASRIGVRVHDDSFVQALLSSGIPACFARTAQRPRTTPQLARFSNLFTSELCPILDADQDHEALLYVASSGEKAREAFEHDQDDSAGALFGIPSCCEDFFRRSWSPAVVGDGDLFAALLEKTPLQGTGVRIPWGCNVAAMYFDAGLCWHFPCALNCPATVATVEARLRTLNALDPTLAGQLVALQRRAFLWSPAHGYGLLPEGALDAARVGDIRWSGSMPGMPVERTVVSWLAENRAEEWRLVVPCDAGGYGREDPRGT